MAFLHRIAQLGNSGFGRRYEFDSNDPFASSEEVHFHWESIERILYLYGKLNPGVGYVQGMNEILAPLYYCLANDEDLESQAHAEADSFYLFTAIMTDSVRDNFIR